MSLYDAMNNMTRTENRMPSYKSTLDACVDLFFKIGASRGKDLEKPMKAAIRQNKDIAMRILLWGRNTDIEAVFNLILNAAQAHGVPQEEMPSAILILSDMQFDLASSGTPALKMIERMYAQAGYLRLEVVFWNLCDRSGNIPATAHDSGVALVSGFSPAVMQALLTGDALSPETIMKKTVCIPRYDWQ